VPNSSSPLYSTNYCVYPETYECFSTSQTTCPAGGELSDFCPYGSSSSEYISPPPPPPQSSSSKTSSSSAASSGSTCNSNEQRGTLCLWNGSGDCWPLVDQETRNNCAKNAWIFNGGTQGEGTLCKGGTFVCGKDNSPPTSIATSLGCCRWYTEPNKCWDVYNEDDKYECMDDPDGNGNRFWSAKCPDKSGTCPK